MNSRLLASLFFLPLGVCLAEDLTLTKDTILRVDRSLISLKVGTTVEVVERAEKTVTVRYKGQTGTIPVASAAAPTKPLAATASLPVKPVAMPTPTPTAAKKSLVVDNPESTYGNLVKKAEKNTAKHEANLVDPVNQVLEDPAK